MQYAGPSYKRSGPAPDRKFVRSTAQSSLAEEQ
jgi:hypothetical protein